MEDVDVLGGGWGCCGAEVFNENTQECCKDGPRPKEGTNSGSTQTNSGVTNGEPATANGNNDPNGPQGPGKPIIAQQKNC